MTAPTRLAETSLRDLYLEAVGQNSSAIFPMQSCLRQAVSLSARTGDIVSLRRLIDTFASKLVRLHDQSLYIGMVAETILSNGELFFSERVELIGWAAPAAYETGDFLTAARLLETLESPTSFDLAMLACCYGEINRHVDALRLADALVANSASTTTHQHIASLIRLASSFALGRRQTALSIFEALVADAEVQTHKLFGFVLRYAEIVYDFPRCTPFVVQSIAALSEAGLKKASAYSGLAAAMHIAYEGHLVEARDLIASNRVKLAGQVRDSAIVLNNLVVVDLLSPKPEFATCVEQLNEALIAAGDSFYRFVLHSNLLISYWQLGDRIRALHCVDVIDATFSVPSFGNRDVFWPAYFNAWQFLLEVGNLERAERCRSTVLALGLEDGAYPAYWRFRFGLSDTPPSEFAHLLAFKYHPEYLSHWMIDLEGLELLKAESPP